MDSHYVGDEQLALAVTTLREALRSCELQVTEGQLEKLACHLLLVIAKNKQFNLTRISGVEAGAYLHVADSLLLRSALEAAPRGPFVDVGTGAGFPGIPLAVVTGRKGLLIDSVGKKVAAVNEFLAALDLSGRVSASQMRAEELGRERRGQYAAVVARAVAQTGVLVEYAAPMLRRGGRLVVAKARPGEEELATAKRTAEVCGLKLVSRETFELPEDRGHREVLSYERVGNPAVKLPRATGMAQHHPLA